MAKSHHELHAQFICTCLKTTFYMYVSIWSVFYIASKNERYTKAQLKKLSLIVGVSDLTLSPQPLPVLWRRVGLFLVILGKDWASRISHEDEVQVGHQHGQHRQKGEPEPKTPQAASPRCCNPVHQPVGYTNTVEGHCCLCVPAKWMSYTDTHTDMSCMKSKQQDESMLHISSVSTLNINLVPNI